MKTYQIKLFTQSGTITPFHSDTLFGHLCWIVAQQKGEESLHEFLKLFKEGNPPFVISDGFPADLLPKPLTTDLLFKNKERKDIRKIDFVTLEEFNDLRKSKECEIREKVSPVEYRTTPRSKINRLTGTTPTEGGLYSLEEYFMPYISIYLKVISDDWKENVLDLFRALSISGYGSKKSIGKGQFKIDNIEEFKFEEIKGVNGFVTLSNFCPKNDDPIEGLYKTFVKYGKLGEEFTFCGNPFKRPLVMIKTGSVFKTNGPPKEFYGHMVENISPAKPEVVHYAYAFAVPIKIDIK